MGRFFFGQIVLVWVSDGLGRTKERPAVIISTDEDCEAGLPLQVVAITTQFDDPIPSHHYLVHATGVLDPRTGLNAPCVAKCNWVREVRQDRVIKHLGVMPIELLEAIVETVNALCDDPDFGDWQ